MREPPDVRVPANVSVEQSAGLSAEQVAALRRAAAPGIDAPDGRLARDRALATLGDLYARRGVTLRPEHHAWARKVLGMTDAPTIDPAGA